jgi:hypothetical protein
MESGSFVSLLRKAEHVSMEGRAGSATSESLTAIGYGTIGIEIE